MNLGGLEAQEGTLPIKGSFLLSLASVLAWSKDFDNAREAYSLALGVLTVDFLRALSALLQNGFIRCLSFEDCCIRPSAEEDFLSTLKAIEDHE